MKLWSRSALAGASFLALAAACGNFGDDAPATTTDAGNTVEAGSREAGGDDRDAGGIVDGAAGSDASDAAPRWCDGGHAFCADFDDLTSGDSLFKGWTEAAKGPTGVKAALTQTGAASAPNAARLELGEGQHTYYVFSKTVEAAPNGARIKTATVSFAMRPKLGDGDVGKTHYTIGVAKLRNANGDVVGRGTLDWYVDHVTAVGWLGNGGGVGQAYQSAAGVLAGDEWLTVSIAFDLTNSPSDQKVVFKVQDATGVKLGESTTIQKWPEIASIVFEVGVGDSDEQRAPLTLLIDNVVADVVR